jgi:DNA-binding transcriptional MerR regulator
MSMHLQRTHDETGLLTIGALAQMCGVTVRTLRYYEEMDLISPMGRTQGRYRLYHPRTLKRIKAILALQDLSYTLEEILQVLGPSSVVANVSNKEERIQVTREALARQSDCIDGKLKVLRRLKKEIDNRLLVLDSMCVPCLQETPHQDCWENCAHRDIHVD